MNPMIEKYLGAAVRTLIALGLGALGMFTDTDVEKWSALASGFLVPFLWSAWEKRQSQKEKLVAAASGPTTLAEVKAKVKAGEAPPLDTAVHVIPTLAK